MSRAAALLSCSANTPVGIRGSKLEIVLPTAQTAGEYGLKGKFFFPHRDLHLLAIGRQRVVVEQHDSGHFPKWARMQSAAFLANRLII